MAGNGHSSTVRRLLLFFVSVTAVILVRNTFYMLASNSDMLTDDMYLKDTGAQSVGGSQSPRGDVEATIRQWSTNSSSPVNAKKLAARVLANDMAQLLREKNNKNHTLLKANMSHVGEIVKKLKDSPSINPTANFASPHAFKYVINSPNICGKDRVFIIVYIHTAPDHYKRRTIIRQTWGNVGQYDVPMRLVFVMGVASISADLNGTQAQKALFFESEQYGDLVQEDFLDSYHNLTHKGVAALKWISNYCKQAVFVLKTDDDIFVNTYTLIRHMLHLERDPKNTRGLLMCAVWYGMTVMRTGKWKVTKEEWKEDSYPTYCSGSAFILSTDVAIRLHEVSYHVPFFWVDDFYVTGLLPLKAGNITHRQFLSTFVLNGDKLEEMFTGSQWYSYIFSHVHDLNRIQAVWEKMSKMAHGKLPVVIQTALPGQLAALDKKAEKDYF